MQDEKDSVDLNQDVPLDRRARREIVTVLPGALMTALAAYETFLNEGPEQPVDSEITKTKLFSDHHAACKMAVGHIELLIKLAERVDLFAQGDESNAPEDLKKFLVEAMADLKDYQVRGRGGHGES